MAILTAVNETIADVEAVKGFFDSLTLSKIIPPLIVFLVGLVAVRLLLKLFDRALERSKLERAAYAMLRTGMKVLLYVILILTVAGQLGVNVSSLVAVLSVVSLALSLAVQGALTNIVGGITLLTTHPFKAGDYVEIGDISGTVQEVGVTYTKLLTPDSKTICIPNSTAAAAEITNYSTAGTRRVEITVSVDYGSQAEAVKAALLRAAALPAVLPEPAPFAGLQAYGDSAVVYVLQFWTQTADYWPTFYAVNEAIAREFARDGIVMPYPHLQVHLDGATKGQRNPSGELKEQEADGLGG